MGLAQLPTWERSGSTGEVLFGDSDLEIDADDLWGEAGGGGAGLGFEDGAEAVGAGLGFGGDAEGGEELVVAGVGGDGVAVLLDFEGLGVLDFDVAGEG